MEYLNQIDTELFQFLNSLHHPLLDDLMLMLSYNYIVMGALLIALLFWSFYKFKQNIFLVFIFLIIGFGASDSISTKVFKDNIKRLRPCHQEALKESTYLAGKKCWGGKYGFVSSHASNSFMISTFFILLFGMSKKYSFLWVYSFFVAYSRIYLGRHFPGDIIAGAILGILCAIISYKMYLKVESKFIQKH